MNNRFKNWIIRKTSICLFIFLFTIIPAGSAVRSFGSGIDTDGPVISIDVKDVTLMNAIEIISRASGYGFTLHGGSADMPVSLVLKKAPLEEVLSRLLRNMNHAVIWNETEKSITLFIYEGLENRKKTVVPAEISSEQTVSEIQKDKIGKEINPISQIPSDIKRKPTQQKQKARVSISGKNIRFEQSTKTTID